MEDIVTSFKSHAGNVSSGTKYEPVHDGSHRKLGVQLEGMYYFLEEIGFIEWEYPDLWASKWATRRGQPQERGLALRRIEEEIKCKDCYTSIARGETAYLDLDREKHKRDIHDKKRGVHVDCMNRRKQTSKRCEYGDSVGWRYVDNYVRGSRLDWFRGPIPEIDDVCGYMDTSPGMKHMTGYDLVSFINDWLIREGYQHLSLAEILLTEDRFAHLRQYVGIANIFWSHVDVEPVIDHCKGTFVRIREARKLYKSQLPPQSDQYFWVDYFSLRQGIDNDFEIEAIISLIKEIKNVICSLEDSNGSVRTYLSRSFCLLEIFSAMGDEMNLICYGNRVHRGVLEAQLAPHCPQAWQHYWPRDRWVGPINTASASTSNTRDKQKIDDYIQESFGFARFDLEVSQAILRGAACDRHRSVNCQECPLFFYSRPCRTHQQEFCGDCWTKFEFCGVNAIDCLEHREPLCSICY